MTRVTEQNDDHSGVLLLRAWIHDDEIVGRVRSTAGDEALHDVALGVGVERIMTIVRGWLDELVATKR